MGTEVYGPRVEEKQDAARHRQDKREASETRKIGIVQGSVEPPKRCPLAKLRVEGILYGHETGRDLRST